jgi:hypothetical protein
MKNYFLASLLLLVATSHAQIFERKVPAFDQVIVSPRINLVLIQGDEETVKVDYSNIAEHKINVVVKNHKLRIYLDHARILEKRSRFRRYGEVVKESIYKDVSITAYVTYKQLKKLSIRGEQQVDVQGKIDGKKFKLSAYGEGEISIASVKVDKLKVALYGQHLFKVNEGSAGTQKFKLFGDNKIDTQALQSDEVASTTYGESKLKFNAKDNIRVVTLGESKVYVKGNADIDQFSLGEVSVRKMD